MNPSDAALFDNWLRNRDAEAFKLLATRYAAMVYETCRRILNNPTEAEDVTQECFVILATTRKPIGAYLAPWLHRVAYNQSIVRLRSERRRKDREVRFSSQHPAASEMTWDEIGSHIDEAIAALPEKLRIPVVAHFLDGQTHESIARTFGIPRSTVSYRVEKGVESLRKSLKKKGLVLAAPVLATVMKSSATPAGVPPVVLSNLGKLALSGAHHVAVPAASAPLAKSVLGILSSKTLLASVAGLSLVIFAGWEFIQSTPLPDHSTTLSSTKLPKDVLEAMPEMAPPTVGENGTAPANPNPSDKKKKTGSFETAAAGPSNVAPPRNAFGGIGRTFGGITDGISNTLQSLKRELNGENDRRQQCQTNLKDFGIVFKMFSNETQGGFWPMLSSKPGHLMFENAAPGSNAVYPTYMKDTDLLLCPTDALHRSDSAQGGLDLLNNSSYVYLGYAVRSVEELQAFAQAYRDRIDQALSFDTDLETPSGKIYRLREGVEQVLVTDLNNPAAWAKLQSEIPVLIEIPHHDPMGGNVLYMDGHVAFLRYLEQGQYPMNAATMEILQSMVAMKGMPLSQ